MILEDFDEEAGILFVKYEGNLKAEEIIEFIGGLQLNDSYPRDLKIFINSANTIFNFETSDIQLIADANNLFLEKYNTAKVVIIHDTPHELAYSMLFERLAINKKYMFKVFSTEDEALWWLTNA